MSVSIPIIVVYTPVPIEIHSVFYSLIVSTTDFHCSSTETKFIVCELCNIQVTSSFELKQHLGSSSHRSNEERLFSDDLELDKALEERESKKLTT